MRRLAGHFLQEEIELPILTALASRDGEEVLPERSTRIDPLRTSDLDELATSIDEQTLMIRHLITTFPATTVFTATCCVLTAAPAMAQLRIVTYNSATDTTPGGADVPRAGMASVLEGLGIESRNGIQRPVDILAVQEVNTGLNGAQQLMNQLNSIYGAGTYARSMLPGASTDGTTEAVIYNTNTVQLVAQQDIGVASTVGHLPHPSGSNSTRSGTTAMPTSTSTTAITRPAVPAATRAAGPSKLRQFAATPTRSAPSTKAIFLGDYNVQSSSETSYQILTGTSPAPAAASIPSTRPVVGTTTRPSRRFTRNRR